MEIWKRVPGASGHEVSSLGRVRNRYTGALLRPALAAGGQYPSVEIRLDGPSQARYVHEMVCSAFHGPRPEGGQVRHLDGDPNNCEVTNLSWGTAKQNAADKIAHGRQVRGEAVHSARLTESAVRAIRASVGIPRRELARQHGVSVSTITTVLAGRSWRHVDEPRSSDSEAGATCPGSVGAQGIVPKD